MDEDREQKYKLIKINQQELNNILELHRKYIDGDKKNGMKANLNYKDLRGLDFSNQNLIDISIAHSNLIRTNFSKSNLKGIKFCSSNLKFSNFGHTKLNGVNFDNADLTSLTFAESFIKHSSLCFSNLNKTDFTRAVLVDIKIEKTKFDKAIFLETGLYKIKESPYISIGNIGSRNDTTYYFYDINRVICGCFDGTIQEFEEKVEKRYGKCKTIDDLCYWRSYMIAIDTLKKLTKINLYKNKKEEFDLYKKMK